MTLFGGGSLQSRMQLHLAAEVAASICVASHFLFYCVIYWFELIFQIASRSQLCLYQSVWLNEWRPLIRFRCQRTHLELGPRRSLICLLRHRHSNLLASLCLERLWLSQHLELRRAADPRPRCFQETLHRHRLPHLCRLARRRRPQRLATHLNHFLRLELAPRRLVRRLPWLHHHRWHLLHLRHLHLFEVLLQLLPLHPLKHQHSEHHYQFSELQARNSPRFPSHPRHHLVFHPDCLHLLLHLDRLQVHLVHQLLGLQLHHQ